MGFLTHRDKYATNFEEIGYITDVKQQAHTSNKRQTHLWKLKIPLDSYDEYRFQVNPKVSHLHAVKRIFRYLKGQPKLGLWYPKDSPFDLVAYTDSDYAGASLDRKSTTGGCQFLGYRLISWQCKKQTVVANSTTEAEYVAALSCCGQNGIGVNAGDSKLMLLGINLLLLGKVNAARHNLLLLVARKRLFWKGNTLISNHGGTSSRINGERRPMKKDTEVPQPSDPTNVVDETVNEEMDDSLVRAATTATCLDADSGGGPRRRETMGDTIAQTGFENVSMKLQELMELYTNLQKKKDDDVQVNTATTTVSTASTTTTTIPSKDKGKGIMVEEPLKMKKKDQISFDEQEAIRLQAKFNEEIDVDYQLAQRLQAQEQEELAIKERAKLFQQLLEKRRNHFAAKRAEEKRNRPPTKAQQRSIMCTYLKNMAGWKPNDLKNKSFDSI
ncbi:hypothetical protein Tco_1124297 [Tanacetum coccineum]|uniref:Uncharacterized protein n=1 Tax=Tanacetum coccineum TaxID=301880 RepID=A0ABQ5J5Q2_9ASTR